MMHLVLLPGLDGSGLLFEAFRQELPRELSVATMEYPNRLPLDYNELENLVIRQLPGSGTIVLLGESFSGPIATAVAARLPDRVCGLVLCCSFIRNPRPLLAILTPLIALLTSLPVPMGIAARLLLGRSPTTELRDQLITVVRRVSPAVLRQRLRSIVSADARAALRSIRVPVLYLQADADLLVPAGAAQIARAVCPHLRLVRIRGPHALLQISPIATAAAVASFVRGIENGSRGAAD